MTRKSPDSELPLFTLRANVLRKGTLRHYTGPILGAASDNREASALIRPVTIPEKPGETASICVLDYVTDGSIRIRGLLEADDCGEMISD